MSVFQLPILNPLRATESTYITFSKALNDFDIATAFQKPYYFTKMVAIKLPNWESGKFYNSARIPLSRIGKNTNDPNSALPAYIQHYMENICRQDIDNPNVTEIAFWKMLAELQSKTTEEVVTESVKLINSVVNSDYHRLESNIGWGTIICHIPPGSKQSQTVSTLVNNLPSLVVTNDLSDAEDNLGLYDNGNKQILFENQHIIDFNLTTESNIKTPFDFNAILLFYKDGDDVHKLHGINFIHSFQNKIGSWELPSLQVKPESITTMGYQFIFNLKTVNNEATKNAISYVNDQLRWYSGFEKTFEYMHELLKRL